MRKSGQFGLIWFAPSEVGLSESGGYHSTLQLPGHKKAAAADTDTISYWCSPRLLLLTLRRSSLSSPTAGDVIQEPALVHGEMSPANVATIVGETETKIPL